MDRLRDRRARAGMNPEVLRRVALLLAERWDPGGEFTAPDGLRAPRAHAAAVVGILAAGGSPAEVVGYLRRAEVAVDGGPRSSGESRWALVEAVQAVVREAPVAGRDDPPAA